MKNLSQTTFVLIILLLPSITHGARTTLTPSISARTTYTSNVDRVPDEQNPQDDFITTISPRISFDVAGKSSNWNAGYTASRVYYSRSTTEEYWRHSFDLGGESQLTRNTSFSITGRYFRTEDPADTDNVDFTDTGGRFLREIYNADADLSYQFARRGTVSLGAGYGENLYDDPAAEESRNYRAFLDLSYGFLWRWTAGMTLRYRYGEFERSDDFDNYNGSAFLAYQINPKMSAYVTYQLTSYLSELDDDEDDADRVHDISVGFDYQISSDKNLNLEAGYFVRRLPDQEDESDAYATMNFTKFFRRGSLGISAGSGYDYTYFSAENLGFNYFYFAILNGDYIFNSRLSGNAYFNYRRSEYDIENDTRDNYTAGCGLSYQLLRLLFLQAGYSVRYYKPDDPTLDYVDHRAYISLSATKDFLIWN